MTNLMSRALFALSVTLACHSAITPAVAEGNLASNPTALDLHINSDELTFSSTEYRLETGKYYNWNIEHDGGEEFSVVAPELFRNAWINQIVINDLEVKAFGLYSVEFDDAGTISVSFVPIRPGEYAFYVPGYENRGLAGKFIVK
ncbi:MULTISPECIES: hypothetical protein [unclassified Devosia]|uniref:hypothetical protein n=1 Tax=unclassified Devosia TaxID=196773 RepID=UPI001AEEFFD2|nr:MULTISPECIES: hypothetical protein [unclassified Devosia]